MTPVYVSKLFDLLRSLGVEQRSVVRTLGASETQVSLWAHGKRPLPKAQVAPFLRLVLRELKPIQARADEESRTAPLIAKGHTILTTPRPAISHSDEARQAVEEWAYEIADHSGELTRRVQSCARILAELAHQDPMKLSEEDALRYDWAVKQMQWGLRTIRRRQGLSLVEEDTYRRINYNMEVPLVERYKQLCRAVGVDVEAGE